MSHHLMTAAELAAIFQLTPRRIGQYRDDKLLPAVERGKFDAAWFAYLRKGEERAEGLRSRPHRDILVALGWLAGTNDNPHNDELAMFADLFDRNGSTRDAALVALGRAQQLVTR